MRHFLLATSAAAGLALSAGAASAEPDGWYGAVDAGYQFIDDVNLESSTTGVNWNYEVNDGWAAFARLGYRFNPNWRVELEGGYRSGDIGTVRRANDTVPSGLCNTTPAVGPCYSPEGDLTATTLMANVIYDFGWEFSGVRPFVGLGAGINYTDGQVRGNLRGDRGTQLTNDDSTTNFAAQAIAGLAFAVGDRMNIDLTYRYLTGDTEMKSFTSGPVDYGTWEGDYDQSHTV
ncbi:MAG: porin family protein, partial [Caulobacteraceae bacterium]